MIAYPDLMWWPGWHKQQLAWLEADAVARNRGEVARSEDGVQAVIEHGIKVSSCLNKHPLWTNKINITNLGWIKCPFLHSRHEIHPEMWSKSINVQPTVCAGPGYEQTRPALIVQRIAASSGEIIVRHNLRDCEVIMESRPIEGQAPVKEIILVFIIIKWF